MRYLICFLLFFWALCGQAQQTLQFNQCLLIDNVEDTVPSGKVWKLVSVLYSSPTTNIQGGNQNDNMLINGTNVTVRTSRSSNGGYNGITWGVWEQHFPMWLPAGTRLQTGTNVHRINVLEFNVQP